MKISLGDRFGRLLVLRKAEKRKNSTRTFWVCLCDCGTEKEVHTSGLISGTQSCGCLQRERAKGRPESHGMSKNTEYRAWQQMKVRCLNPKSTSWAHYGGRGITVCQEWIESFEAFFEHIGPKTGPEYSLDRIDNDGHYMPGNVKWSTSSEQRRNQKRRRVKPKPLEKNKKDGKKKGQWFWRGKWRNK